MQRFAINLQRLFVAAKIAQHSTFGAARLKMSRVNGESGVQS